MSAVTPFNFEGMDVRITNQVGEPWFVLADVCRVLEVGNTADAARRLDDDEKAEVDIVDTSSNGVAQRRSFTIINESGLYSLILTSRKPAAKRFKKWVTAEVLPAIRRTGRYDARSANPLLNAILPTVLPLLDQCASEWSLGSPFAQVTADQTQGDAPKRRRRHRGGLTEAEQRLLVTLRTAASRTGHEAVALSLETLASGVRENGAPLERGLDHREAVARALEEKAARIRGMA